MVGIAQLVRAPDCGSGGPRFESVYPPHKYILGCSQVGKAQDFDSCIPWVRVPPAQPLFLFIEYAPLAQLAEHLTFNQGVRGSNPRWSTRIGKIS